MRQPSNTSTGASDDYGDAFFDRMDSAARSSADVVVPYLMKLLAPKRIVDVGSGRGEWLASFLRHGAEGGLAIDGPWVKPSALAVPREQFRIVSLNQDWLLEESFDLAVCLEVAEHIPKQHSDRLIRNLTDIAPAVLFSAALPGQQGTNHINEQWPDFWNERFRAGGFVRLDAVRPLIWQDERVAWYYQQNIYIFVAEKLLQANEALREAHTRSRSCALTLIHPKSLRPMRNARSALENLPRLLWGALARRLSRTD